LPLDGRLRDALAQVATQSRTKVRGRGLCSSWCLQSEICFASIVLFNYHHVVARKAIVKEACTWGLCFPGHGAVRASRPEIAENSSHAQNLFPARPREQRWRKRRVTRRLQFGEDVKRSVETIAPAVPRWGPWRSLHFSVRCDVESAESLHRFVVNKEHPPYGDDNGTAGGQYVRVESNRGQCDPW